MSTAASGIIDGAKRPGRMLVLLGTDGETRLVTLAERLVVDPSTVVRMMDRLVDGVLPSAGRTRRAAVGPAAAHPALPSVAPDHWDHHEKAQPQPRQVSTGHPTLLAERGMPGGQRMAAISARRRSVAWSTTRRPAAVIDTSTLHRSPG
jgi:hypothetical protein